MADFHGQYRDPSLLFFITSRWLLSFSEILRLLAHRQETFFVYVLALGTLAVVQGLVNSFLVIIGLRIKTGCSILRAWREEYSWVLVTSISGVLAAGVVNALIHYYGFWPVTFIIPVLLGNYLAYHPYLKNIEAARQHVTEIQESEASFRSAFDHAVDWHGFGEPSGRWLQVNHSLCKIVGYSEEELLETDSSGGDRSGGSGDLARPNPATVGKAGSPLFRSKSDTCISWGTSSGYYGASLWRAMSPRNQCD